MNRTDWKTISRTTREIRNAGKRHPVTEFEVNGIPYRAIAAPGKSIKILTNRIPDRPTAQLVARELDEAAEARRDAAARIASSAKRAARLSLEMARAWRKPGWREAARAAARQA